MASATASISFRKCDEPILERVTAMAAEQGVSVSRIVVGLLREALEKVDSEPTHQDIIDRLDALVVVASVPDHSPPPTQDLQEQANNKARAALTGAF